MAIEKGPKWGSVNSVKFALLCRKGNASRKPGATEEEVNDAARLFEPETTLYSISSQVKYFEDHFAVKAVETEPGRFYFGD
jgi:hypothetical protein